MKLEQKVYIYGFTLGEIGIVTLFFLAGFVTTILSVSKVGFFWGMMILGAFIAAPVTFIKLFIHSKNEGYFLNLIMYYLRPKVYIPIRNIESKEKRER